MEPTTACHAQVTIESGNCWGSVMCEDTGEGACDLCVQECPEVFEKRLANACAHILSSTDLAAHVTGILRAAGVCPTNAIHYVAISQGAA